MRYPQLLLPLLLLLRVLSILYNNSTICKRSRRRRRRRRRSPNVVRIYTGMEKELSMEKKINNLFSCTLLYNVGVRVCTSRRSVGVGASHARVQRPPPPPIARVIDGTVGRRGARHRRRSLRRRSLRRLRRRRHSLRRLPVVAYPPAVQREYEINLNPTPETDRKQKRKKIIIRRSARRPGTLSRARARVVFAAIRKSSTRTPSSVRRNRRARGYYFLSDDGELEGETEREGEKRLKKKKKMIIIYYKMCI